MAWANMADVVLDMVDTNGIFFVQNVYGALSMTFSTFVWPLITISVIIFGFAMMMGWIEYPLREFGKKVLLITTILALISTWSFFNIFFYQMFTDGPDEVATIILNWTGIGTPLSTSSKLGELMTQSFVLAGEAFDADGWFMKYILGAMIVLACLAYCVYALALIVIAKIGTIITLALGPIFIVFLMFSATKNMFGSWLQQLFQFAFTLILTYLVIIFFMGMYEKSLDSLPSSEIETLADIIPLVVVSFIGMLVLAQVQSLASGLASGAQLGTLGAFAAIGRRLNRVEWRSRGSSNGNSGGTSTQNISRR
ncbi:type IV secretion system protein [Gilvimarinus chinensis]|uniref:type IV secretion system protein n=1 Tax=Gilvimarinus chinensis TaxID=396005 RepID=UPI00038107C3|nr:type IV secretion system protein [Gilvimarinus chinensis]